VQRVAQLIRGNYADPKAGEQMAAAVESRLRQGAYAGIDSASGLTDSLTRHLRAIHPDQHLRLDYFVVARPMRAEAGTPSPEDVDARRLQAARRGYGIEKVERLPGNVAVIALRSFEPTSYGAAPLAAAMELAASADALIIDLRQNGGGYGDMVGELLAYFLPGGIRTSERFDRPSGKTIVGRLPTKPRGTPFGNKPVSILTSRRTFSAAEAFAYSMQARTRATIVGETSRGGANPVQVFQLSPHFALFLPTGRVTDDVTKTNWEGVGVKPDRRPMHHGRRMSRIDSCWSYS